MDILTHSLSGALAGTVVASIFSVPMLNHESGTMEPDRANSFKEKNSTVSIWRNWGIVVAGFVGGLLPDLDAISLWSGFDAMIGRWLKLMHSGKEIYFGKFWYSHHGFMHSVAAGLLMMFLFAVFLSVFKVIIDRIIKSTGGSIEVFYKERFFVKLISSVKYFFSFYRPMFAFFLGFIIHLLQDLPTPKIYWGGIRLLWPSTSYVGGTGQIWWWNNYDLLLIVMIALLANLIFLSVMKICHMRCHWLPLLFFIFAISVFLWQIKSRPISFQYSNYTYKKYQKNELRSLQLQKKILGYKVFRVMQILDSTIYKYLHIPL